MKVVWYTKTSVLLFPCCPLRELKEQSNFKDFISLLQGCKKLYCDQLQRKWGNHCGSCSYCHSISRTGVTAKCNGSEMTFCSEDCCANFKILSCCVSWIFPSFTKSSVKYSRSLTYWLLFTAFSARQVWRLWLWRVAEAEAPPAGRSQTLLWSEMSATLLQYKDPDGYVLLLECLILFYTGFKICWTFWMEIWINFIHSSSLATKASVKDTQAP